MSKLLLVEDDNNLREIYEARLQAEGYTIVAAKDGEEALAVAKSERPDLIISDVMMPKISGFEMLDIIKNTDGLKNVKVIMLTALGQSDDQKRADTLGADRYLVKSQVTLEDIVRVAHELLEDGEEAPQVEAPAATPAPAPAVTAAEETAPVTVAPTTEPVTAAPASEPAATPATAATEPAKPAAAAAPAATTTDANTTPVEPATPSSAGDTSAAATKSSEEAMPASQESANLEDQIEDIIEGASTDAPSPEGATESVTPSPEPMQAAPTEEATAPVAEPVTPAPATSETEASAADVDDKLMTDAVKSLTNEPSAPVVEPANSTPVSPSAPAATPVATTAKIESATPAANASTMSHEKIISPPADNEVNKKPDIQALFAAEQAKEAGIGDVVTPQVQTDSSSSDKPLDPNSISL